jgi:glycerol uptake facilitator-like aquaporin
MEAKGHDRMPLVLFLEFFGTALFIWGIINTDTPTSIPFSLFASVVIFGDITGGHFNPAVTLGVFISLGNYAQNILFCCLIMLAQFAGGFAAIGLSWLGTLDIWTQEIKTLTPSHQIPYTGGDPTDWSMYVAVIVNEIICTFLFVSVILMVKGEHTAGDRKGICAALVVVSTLLCVISGTNKLGACFNPAVATGFTTWSVLRIDTGPLPNNFLYDYLWCYMVGPFLGGLFAGLFHLIHAKFHAPEEEDKSQLVYDSEVTESLSHE